jgi:hypothetical protein
MDLQNVDAKGKEGGEEEGEGEEEADEGMLNDAGW